MFTGYLNCHVLLIVGNPSPKLEKVLDSNEYEAAVPSSWFPNGLSPLLLLLEKQVILVWMWKWINVACQETKPVPGDQLMHKLKDWKRKLQEIRELQKQWFQIHTRFGTQKSVSCSQDGCGFGEGAFGRHIQASLASNGDMALRWSHSQPEHQIKISIPWPCESVWAMVARLSK